MVVGTNLRPTGIPSLGCGEEENIIQREQLSYEAAWL